MPGDFYQQFWPLALPSYMRGPHLTTLAEAVGAEQDAQAEQVLRGRMQSIVFAGGPNPQRIGAARLADGRLIECEPVFLPVHSDQRGIKLYDTEPVLSKRIRLSMWWQLRKERGTHWGEMNHARPYFSASLAYPTITCVFQTNEATPAAIWYRMAPDGTRTIRRVSPSNFNYDNRPTHRSRVFWFVDMSATGYAAPNAYDSGGLYDTSGWIYDAPSFAVQADIAAMLALDWKSAHSWPNMVALWWPMTGGAPFPSHSGTPTQDTSGWWSLPNGAGTWASLVGPDGRGTRPPNLIWILDNNAP